MEGVSRQQASKVRRKGVSVSDVFTEDHNLRPQMNGAGSLDSCPRMDFRWACHGGSTRTGVAARRVSACANSDSRPLRGPRTSGSIIYRAHGDRTHPARISRSVPSIGNSVQGSMSRVFESSTALSARRSRWKIDGGLQPLVSSVVLLIGPLPGSRPHLARHPSPGDLCRQARAVGASSRAADSREQKRAFRAGTHLRARLR